MKAIEKLENTLMPVAKAIGKNKYLTSIRDGFLVSMPLLIIGSFFMLISNFPIPAWMELAQKITIGGKSISALCSVATTATFSLMAIFVVLGIGYNFAKHMEINPLHGAAVSLVGWFMLMPMYTPFTPTGATEAVRVASVPMDWTGSRGIFVGIISAFLAVHIYKWVVKRGWIIKMPEGVPPTVAGSFASLIPALGVMVSFLAIHIFFTFMPWDNAFEFIFRFLQMPLQHIGDSLGTMLIIYLFAHVLWFFGIHGTNITDSVFLPILISLSAENLVALQANQALPHIINRQFQDLFATFGGGGSTLSLLIAILIFCQSKRLRQLGKLSIFPGIFGINEPVIFGLPVVLNPIIAIPFIGVPLLNILCSYVAMSIGLVPICNGILMPWTTPPIISGFLSSGIRGAILQAVMMVVGVFCYLPFIKTIDKQYLSEEKNPVAVEEEEQGSLSFDDL